MNIEPTMIQMSEVVAEEDGGARRDVDNPVLELACRNFLRIADAEDFIAQETAVEAVGDDEARK